MEKGPGWKTRRIKKPDNNYAAKRALPTKAQIAVENKKFNLFKRQKRGL